MLKMSCVYKNGTSTYHISGPSGDVHRKLRELRRQYPAQIYGTQVVASVDHNGEMHSVTVQLKDPQKEEPRLRLGRRTPAAILLPRPVQGDHKSLVRAALEDTIAEHGETLKALAKY